MKERIEEIFTDVESGKNFPFDENTIKRRSTALGDNVRAYYEFLPVLRTQLNARMQEDMDYILDEVMTAMKDKFGYILGNTGRLSGRFGSENHEILGRLISHIKENNLDDRVPTILHGLELLDSWRLSYRNFAQHRIREALNCLDPLDKANESQGMPSNPAQILDLLQDSYEQAVYEMRKKFEGANGIYSEPNKAAFTAAEEFKDIMIRSGSSESRLKNEWKRLYRPIRGDIWPEEFGKTQRKRDASAGIRGHLQEIDGILQDFPRMKGA